MTEPVELSARRVKKNVATGPILPEERILRSENSQVAFKSKHLKLILLMLGLTLFAQIMMANYSMPTQQGFPVTKQSSYLKQ